MLDVIAASQAGDVQAHGEGRFTAFADFGELVLQGWAIARSAQPIGVVVRDGDGEAIARAPLGTRRPDIAEAFPDVAGAERCGFRLHLSPRGAGIAPLDLLLVLGDGSECRLGSVEVRVDVDESALPQPPKRSVEWTVTALDGESAKVLRGRDGWLYLRQDTNDVIGQHTGRVALSDDNREAWRRLLAARLATTERLGATWECLVAPDKESVYPEHLPGAVVPAARRPIHDFLDLAAATGAPVTYPLDDLTAEKPLHEIYFRNDTHWNHRGAFVAYRRLCRNLIERGVEIDPLDEAAIAWVSEAKRGDLGEKCYPEPVYSPSIRAQIENRQAALRFDNDIRNHGRVMIFERLRDTDGPSCVLFGESFAEGILPFLRETFRRLVFVHTSMLVEEIVRQEQPEVVLTVPVERFLLKVPDDRDGFERLARTAGEKGGSLPWTGAR